MDLENDDEAKQAAIATLGRVFDGPILGQLNFRTHFPLPLQLASIAEHRRSEVETAKRYVLCNSVKFNFLTYIYTSGQARIRLGCDLVASTAKQATPTQP